MMKLWILALAALILLSGCTTQIENDLDQEPSNTADSGAMDLPDHGPAPMLIGSTWLNTEKALDLVHLRGNVVLIDFWTFG